VVFSEPFFLFAFLPISLALIYLFGRRMMAPMMLATSLLFYAWGSGVIVLVLVLAIVFNWFWGLMIERERSNRMLYIGAAVNLIVLAYFKYAFFFASNVDRFAGTNTSDVFKAVILPIGISFFIFQAVSYLIDVKRGDVRAEPKLIVFGAYLSFFPQLIAGPIVRFKDVIVAYHKPDLSLENASAGATRFVHGLLKKVIVADSAGAIADACFAVPANDLTMGAAWLGAIAYTLQIYFDFSAYSDMAIGLGRMFGIRFNENFLRPYSASTITDFWRRWHVSLSSWFRDYLYIPLGGNRGSTLMTYRNLLIVFFVTGLWHGAAWTFVLWGLYHGAFLIAERLTLGPKASQISNPFLRYMYLLPVVIVGWVLFRAETLAQAGQLISGLVAFDTLSLPLPTEVLAAADPTTVLLMLPGLLIFLAPRSPSIGAWLDQSATGIHMPVRFAYAGVGMVIAGILVLSSSFSPFLYFRF